MKKIVLILIGFCAIGLCAWEAQAAIPNQIHVNMEKKDNHIPSGAEKIELKGRLDLNTGLDDIEAGATENNVYLYFNQSFGNVSILLYDAANNLIYSTIVNTAVQQMVIIPILSATSGTYTVVLSNAIGLAEGDFERGN